MTDPAGGAPRDRVLRECRRRGHDAVVAACGDLLRGGEPEPDLLLALGGPHAQRLLADELPDGQRSWYRVWAGRALLWCWLDDDPQVLTPAFADEAWRVRETACKVVARHLVGDHIEVVQRLTDDPVPVSRRPPVGR